jgi:hypothetical protein
MGAVGRVIGRSWRCRRASFRPASEQRRDGAADQAGKQYQPTHWAGLDIHQRFFSITALQKMFRQTWLSYASDAMHRFLFLFS